MQTLNLTKKYEKYSEYKDSGVEWLGKIPKEWENVRGKTIFYNQKEINKGMISENVLSLTMDGVINRDHENNIGLLPSDYQTFQIFEKDDLVFKLIDLENFKTSRVGIVHEKGIMSSAYIRLIIRNKTFSQKYFFYIYYHFYIRGIYNFLGSGVRSTLNFRDLLNMNILVPGVGEQINIANYLDEKTGMIDQIIEKKKILANLLKEAVYSSALEFSLKNKTKKGLWEVGDNEWGFKKAKWIFNEIKVHNMIDEEQLAVTQENGVIPKRLCNEDFTSASSNENLKLVENEDFVISLRSFQGGIEYSEYKGLVSPAYTVIRLKKEYNIEYYRIYYRYLFKSPEFISILNTVISGVRDGKNINFVDFKNIVLPIPPMNSLKRMESLIRKIGILATNLKKEEDLLKEYKFSLISNVVTGKVKI